MDIINIFCNVIFNIILSFFFVKLRDLRGPRRSPGRSPRGGPMVSPDELMRQSKSA